MITWIRFRNYLIGIFLLLILIAEACESDLNLDIPDSSPILTVNCILKDDESVSMAVTESLPNKISSDTITIVRNASVILTNDDGLSENLIYREQKFNNRITGDYISLNGYKPISENTYQIRIEVLGFEIITSATVIPKSIPILSVDTNTTYINNGGNIYKVLECTVRFEDPIQTGNYYKLSIDRYGLTDHYVSYPFGRTTETVKYQAYFFCPNNNAVYMRINHSTPGSISLENEDKEIWVNEIFIADDACNGSIYELKIYVWPAWFNDRAYPPAGEKITNRTAYIRLYSINEEYYKYANSYFNQLIKRNDIFSEPVQVYSNISNGTGIFSGASASIDSTIVIPVHYNPPIY